MANDAQVFLAGYVATDPVYWQNRDGNSKATLRVAYTPRYVDRSSGEWTDSPTSFVTVICWRKLADNVALCLRKGEPVLVRGRLQVRQWDDREGHPRTRVDVDAQSIGHDLARGVALFQRTRRVTGDTAADGTQAEREEDTAPAAASMPPAAGVTAGVTAGGGRAGGGMVAGAAEYGDAADESDAAEESDDLLDDGAVAALLQGDTGPLAGGDGAPDGDPRPLADGAAADI